MNLQKKLATCICSTMFLFGLLTVNDLLASNKKIGRITAGDSSKIKISGKWHGADKYSHFTISAFLTAGQFFVLREQADFSKNCSLTIAVTSTALIGIAKEVYDSVSKKGTPSFKDLVADFLGIGLAIAVIQLK
ncbi:MAG: VanZ family protein [bacterium]